MSNVCLAGWSLEMNVGWSYSCILKPNRQSFGQQDLQNYMNEAAFSNCNPEDYINIEKYVQTEPDTMDIDALVQNFRESQKEGEEEVEEEEDEN
jgi:hypothetical protein